MTIDEENARSRVPDSKSVTGFEIGLVCIGIAITLPLLYIGGELAQKTGLSRGSLAVVIGALILSLMSVPASVVGVKVRLSSYMIIEHTFGYVGAKLVNLWIGLVLLGWYAVTAELFGKTLCLASSELLSLQLPEWGFTILSSAIVILTAAYGFKAIDRLALVAVPFLVFTLLISVYLSIKRVALPVLIQYDSQQLDLPTAISTVVGTMIVNVVLMPDLTRYARTTQQCVTASFLGNGGGTVIAFVISMIPALALQELEPMKYMILLGFGSGALAVLVFATWTTNVVNLYSTALAGSAAVPSARYRTTVVLCGILGTGVALVGFAEHLIDFLIVLGLMVPPVLGVYLSDFFLFGRQDFSNSHLIQRPAFRVTAMSAAVGGGALATLAYYFNWSLTGIAPLESLIFTVVLYVLLECSVTRKQEVNDACWN